MAWAYFTVHTPLVPGFNHLLLVSQCHYATRSYPRGVHSIDVGRQLKTSLARAMAIRATGLIHEGSASTPH
eukprot:scaffold37912_cov35-Phaeocystis_antarctica.AAC.3